MPAEVVAIAGKPTSSMIRALATSQTFARIRAREARCNSGTAGLCQLENS